LQLQGPTIAYALVSIRGTPRSAGPSGPGKNLTVGIGEGERKSFSIKFV